MTNERAIQILENLISINGDIIIGDEGKEALEMAIRSLQQEQDQPITGNSLEQEWLRYVDKKKKECRGELPFLGEYGWLQIARHFAEWQKSQMPMPEDTIPFNKGVEEGKRLMMEDAVEGEVIVPIYEGDDTWSAEIKIPGRYEIGQKVRIIVLKAEEE